MHYFANRTKPHI